LLSLAIIANMNEFKFQLTTFALVALLAFGGYWAFATLDRGVTYSKEDLAIVPTQEQEKPDELIATMPVIDTTIEEVQETELPESSNTTTTTTTTTLNAQDAQTLAELQKLVVDNINMKEGSAGTRVGTVQKFLNLYFEKQTGIDNGYGPTTRERVKQFQQEQGLTADGLAGPTTYQKMIDVLKKGL